MTDDLQRMFPGIDDGAGPARRMSSAKTAAMTRSIVQQALAEQPAPAPLAEPPVVTRRGRRIALLAAAIVFGTVGVATGAAWFVRARAQVPAVAPAREVPRVQPRAPVVAPVAPPAPAVIDEPPPLDLPAETAPPRRRVAAPAPDELPADAPVEDVLALANQRRKAKRWRDAAELYERVRTTYRGTDAAIVATIAAAGLHLDHLDDAAGARRRYEAALQLAPRGPLAEEARWGLVECARATADADAERAALRAFLAQHADSPNARAAKARLADLERP